jgi:hypothetical protein
MVQHVYVPKPFSPDNYWRKSDNTCRKPGLIAAGAEMRFVVVTEHDGSFNFIAPWGERMVARPGDSIVQDLNNPKDTYRVAKAAFACTYEVLREP